jgi:short-subunit dehydrogenase
MKTVVVIGGTSKIAQEVAKCFAKSGARLFLVGRDKAKLAAVSSDLQVRGARQVATAAIDLNDSSRHAELLEAAISALGNLDVALVAHGTLPDQKRCEQSVDMTFKELTTNFLSVVSLVTLLANYFELRRTGCIAVISSVAGDRGRQSNYVYGTAKGAVSTFLQGVRNRLFKSGVSVLTIKPGFVDTPMTALLSRNRLYADPQIVGRTIFKAIIKGQDVVYVPWFWRWIMLIIRLIPEGLFKRLEL